MAVSGGRVKRAPRMNAQALIRLACWWPMPRRSISGCKADSDVSLPTRPLHYDELDLRGAFHHAPEEVDRALALLADGAVNWRALAAGPIGLEDLQNALASGNDGPARKWVVHPTTK